MVTRYGHRVSFIYMYNRTAHQCLLIYQVTPTMEENFEDTKDVMRIRQSKDRQHNVQKKKDKRTNNNQEKIIKLKIK